VSELYQQNSGNVAPQQKFMLTYVNQYKDFFKEHPF